LSYIAIPFHSAITSTAEVVVFSSPSLLVFTYFHVHISFTVVVLSSLSHTIATATVISEFDSPPINFLSLVVWKLVCILYMFSS